MSCANVKKFSAERKMKNIVIIVVIALLLIIGFKWWKSSSSSKQKPSKKDDTPTIYGSMGCPYTVKQMEKYPNHIFVDCTSEKCPEFVTAYPTTKWPDGKIEVGFS